MSPSPEIPPSETTWMHQGVACDAARRRSREEWARFGVIRARLLRQLRRDPWMWVLQGGNVLRGLARSGVYLGLFLVLVPPVLSFWEGVLWAPADTPPRGSEVVSTWVWRGLLWLMGVVLADLLLGCRLSRVRNVFVDTAERMAWAVVDAAPPAAGGAGPRRPGADEHDTKQAQ
jgi:hypothetical protein